MIKEANMGLRIKRNYGFYLYYGADINDCSYVSSYETLHDVESDIKSIFGNNPDMSEKYLVFKVSGGYETLVATYYLENGIIISE